jgi:hypothetical protein
MNGAVVGNIGPHRSRGPLQTRVASRTPPPWDRPPQVAHKIGDPTVPVKLRHKTPVVATMKTIDLVHTAWGPRLSHRLTLLCQGLRYLKLLREQHLRLAVAGDTTTPCTPTQVLQYPRALRTFLPTRTKRTSSAAACKQNQLSITKPMTPSSHVH